MPKIKPVKNGFSIHEVSRITGLSEYMVDYLARERYLEPFHAKGRIRGKVRYYSYRDLVVARIVRKLLDTGLEIKRLKKAIRMLREDKTWTDEGGRRFEMLATNGYEILRVRKDGNLEELTPVGQQTFAFVLNVTREKEETRQRIQAAKQRHFTMHNERLEYVRPRRKKT